VTKIICSLNQFSGDLAELFDLLEGIKGEVEDREEEIRETYKLPRFVPEWSYFNRIVVDNCMRMKKNRQRLTFSMFNQWVTEFREMTTTNKGFTSLTQVDLLERLEHFRPIILIRPPCVGAN
jgi:hypothetical protein